MFGFRFYSACVGFIKVDGARLGPWEEIVGILDSVETHEERGIIRVSLIRRIGLEIPLDEFREGGVKLEQLKGRKISILRTDEEYILKQSEPDGDIGSKVL